MARQHSSRREAKQPDPFLSWSVVAVAWAKNHIRHILYSFLGMVVVAGLVVAWFSWQSQRRQRAAALLYEARQSLETTAQATSTSSPEQTIESLRTIVDDYGRTPAAAQAYWQLGHLYFARGDYAAALTAYEQAQRRFPGNRELSSMLATLDIAYAQEASKACDKALANYEMVQQSSAIWLHGEAYLGMGRCYEQRQATDQAIAVYERALADGNVMAAARQTISERLARLQPVAKTSAEQSQVTETEPAATPAADDTPAAAPDPSKAMPHKEPNTGALTTNP